MLHRPFTKLVRHVLGLDRTKTIHTRSVLRRQLEQFEDRIVPNAAFDLIGLTAARRNVALRGIDGSNVGIAVLDTGVQTDHQFIRGNYRGGQDFIRNDDNPNDEQGHGTHVSGTAASTNPDIGVATNANLYVLKVGGANGSSSIDGRALVSALQWVLNNSARFNIRVVNMSLGGGFFSNPNQVTGDTRVDLVRRLEAQGVTVVTAAGNSHNLQGSSVNNFRNAGAPAVYSTLSVGAVWQDGTRQNVSFGPRTDITTGPDRVTSFSQRPATAPFNNVVFAPGAIINSTLPGNRTGGNAGTSMASPMVAGVVALMQEAAFQFGGRYLRPEEIRNLLQQNGDRIVDGDDENDNVPNTGAAFQRINVNRTLEAIRRAFDNAAPPQPGLPSGSGDPNGTIANAFSLGRLGTGGRLQAQVDGTVGTDGGSTQVGPRDVDIFRIDLATPSLVTFETNTRGGQDFDTFLRLFTPSGQQILSDDDSGPGLFSRITTRLNPGTYYVGVNGFSNLNYNPNVPRSGTDGQTGDYRFTARLGSNSLSVFDADAATDPNGVLAGATEVEALTRPVLASGIIGLDGARLDGAGGFILSDEGTTNVGPTDYDLYRTTIADTGTLLVLTDTTTLPFGYNKVDTYLSVWRVNANNSVTLLAQQDDVSFGNTDSFLPVPVNRGDVILVGVSGFTPQDPNHSNPIDPTTTDGRLATNVTNGLYNLFLSFENRDKNAMPEQSRGKNPLPVNGPGGRLFATLGSDDVSGSGIFTVGDMDVDTYNFTATQSGVVEVRVDAFQNANLFNPADTILTAYSTDKLGLLTRIGQVDDVNILDPFLRIPVVAGQEYFVTVTGYGNSDFAIDQLGSGSSGSTGDYFISSTFTAASQSKSLSDNSIRNNSPRVINPGQRLFGAIGSDDSELITGAADVDFYQFTPTRTGLYSFNTSAGGVDFNADTVLRVFDANGTQLAQTLSRNSNAGVTTTVALLAGQTYFTGVNGFSPQATSYDPNTGANAFDAATTGEYQIELQALSFGSSDQFLGDNSNFVTNTFADALGRSIDDGGLNFFLPSLDNARQATFGSVAQQIIASQEARNVQVRGYFRDLLGSVNPSASDVQFWVNALNAGNTVQSVQIGFATAQTYFNRAGGTNAGYVNRLFLDFLGRPADAGAQSFTNALNNGSATRLGVAQAVMNSGEYRNRVVDQFYRRHLGRGAGPSDLSFWAPQLGGGNTPAGAINAAERVAIGIAASQAAIQFAGNASQAWVNSIFSQSLNRLPDAAGLAFFNNQILASFANNRTATAQQIAVSVEARNNEISQTIQHYLGRPATVNDLSFWRGQFAAGLTSSQFIANILTSSEYLTQAGGTNGTFVDLLFFDLLGRYGSSDLGTQSFVTALNNGSTTRVAVINVVLTSDEYRGRIVRGLFTDLLRRDATTTDLNLRVGQLRSGATIEQIEVSILSSDEYYRVRAS